MAIAIMAMRVKKRVDRQGARAGGGRTLPSEVCCATIAGGASGRAVATTATGPVQRMPRNCLLSHFQVASLVSKCLTLTYVEALIWHSKRNWKLGLPRNAVGILLHRLW